MKRNTESKPISTLVRQCGRGKVNLQPDFQRGPVWSKAQKRMLVDTVLRDMDIPKIYLREVANGDYEHEVIDGQQRLRAVIDFCAGEFQTERTTIDGKEFPPMSYDDLDKVEDALREQFDSYNFSVVYIRDASEDEVEDMFLRLQGGSPLNAQERRNAISGTVRDFAREMSKHAFFQNCKFNDHRYKFAHVASQMMLLELSGGACNIKKPDLDKMYDKQEFGKNAPEAREMKKTLECLHKAFPGKTPELEMFNSLSMFLLLRYLRKNFAIIGREEEIGEWFVGFEKMRHDDSDKPTDKRENELIEYQEKTRHATDSEDSLNYRQRVLRTHLFGAIPDLQRLDKQRAFTEEQRLAIWRRDKGICQIKNKCDGVKCEWDDPWHADHIKPWSKSGETTVANGQVACAACNLAKGNDG